MFNYSIPSDDHTSANHSSVEAQLGGLYVDMADTPENGARVFKYVEAKTALSAGDVVTYLTTNCYQVTKEIKPGAVAGVAVASTSSGNYTYIQIRGYCGQTITTSGQVAAQDALYLSADNSAVAMTISGATSGSRTLGIALKDDSSTSLTATMLTCPL